MALTNLLTQSLTPDDNTAINNGSSDKSLVEGQTRNPDFNDIIRGLISSLVQTLTRGSDVATGSTVNLSSTSSLYFDLTGTNTVSAITLADTQVRYARAQSAFQLTASSNLVVNGSTSSNYTTVAGDLLVIWGYGSSVVRVWTITAPSAGGGSASADPATNGGDSLGTLALQWFNLFLFTGSAINFNSGDVTITHSSNTLDFAGATTGYRFASGPITPSTNGGIALGTTSLGFSGANFATGATINWGAGDVIETHSANALAWTGASSGYSFDATVTDTQSTNGTATGFAARNSSTGSSAVARIALGNNSSATDLTIDLNGSANSSGYGARSVTLTNAGQFAISAGGIFFVPTVYSQTTATAANVAVDSGGQIRRSTSSRRYKENIAAYAKGLAEVLAMNPVTYTSKLDDDGIVHAGLIAEDLDALGLTEFVQYDPQGRPDALAYGNIVALLINAVKELSARVEALEAP
jgi:hypothetical protein